MDLTGFYRAMYSPFSVSATLVIADGEPTVTVKVNDLTRGVEIPDPAIPGVKTIKPVARMMRSDLVALDLCPNDLDGGLLVFNGKTWKISAWGPRPSPNGEADGELELILIEQEEE